MEIGHVDATMRHVAEQSALKGLRRSGWVPGVLYGGNEPPMNVSVPERVLEAHIRGAKKFIDLSMNGTTVLATIHQVQTDPLTKRLQHVDFYRVTANQKTTTDIPVHLHGVQMAQRHGSIIQQQIRTISVLALPQDTPEYISVDVSSLEAGQHLTVGDIVLPNNVTVKSNTTEVLATALAHSQVVIPEQTTEDDETSP